MCSMLEASSPSLARSKFRAPGPDHERTAHPFRLVSLAFALASSLALSAALAPNNTAEIAAATPVVHTRETLVDLTITTQLTDSAGDPWTGPIRVQVEKLASRRRRTIHAQPDAEGHLDLKMQVLMEAEPTRHKVTIWGSPDGLANYGSAGPFLAPADGIAAHHLVTPILNEGGAATMELDKSVMAAPPLVGTVRIQPAAIEGLHLAVTNGSRSHAQTFSTYHMPWSKALDVGTTLVSVYSWSSDGYWDCMVEDASGVPLVSETLRRGQKEVVIEVPPQVHLDVSVSLANYPHATHVLVVEPSFHQPNPDQPSGSDIDWWELSRNSLEASATLTPQGPGELGRQLRVLKEGCVLQLWARDTSVTGSARALVAWRELPVGPKTQTVTF